MKELRPEQTLTSDLQFPEGPRWHDGKLYFSDFGRRCVVALSESGELETVVELDDMPSGLGWLPDGRLLVVSMTARKLLRLDPGGLVLHADLSELAAQPLNDMLVDDQGRAYVGNFGYNVFGGDKPEATHLLMVLPEGTACPVAQGLVFPNGVVITEDRTRLIVAETWGHRLTVFDIEADGALSSRRVFAELEGREFDGIAVDAEDAVWAACFGQNEFLRIHDGGRVSARVSVGDRNAVACALGGADRRTLFLLTATGVHKMLEGGAQGFIETLRVEVPGAGIP
jgi:sugar lactone lactonase YvrE